MTEKLYNIGEFAAINKITARMLRHYDNIGLFKPATIAENGYRAYSSGQIAIVSLIKKYRDCGFSLSEIEVMLKADEPEIRRLAQEKIQEFYKQDSLSQNILESLRRLSGKEHFYFENHYEISFTQQTEQLLFCLNESSKENEIEKAFDKLYYALDDLYTVPSGLLILLSDLQHNATYRAAIPVKKPLEREGFQYIVLKAGWYLATFHYGDYYSVGEAYDRLLLYAQEQKLQLTETFIERYFVDNTHTANPAEYITEISVKITP